MSKKCPNCGYDEANEAKYCHICGQPLGTVQSADDFEYDFGKEEPSAPQVSSVQEPTQPTVGIAFNSGNGQTQSFGATPFAEVDERPYVATTIDNYKANRYKRQTFSWSAFILIASVLGFIINLTSIDDCFELQSQLPYVLPEYYNAVLTTINVYYTGLVLLVLMIVASIVFLIFGAKLNKFNFPVQNDEVFYAAKKVFFASIAVVVIEFVLLIVGLISIINSIELLVMLEEVDLSVGMDVGFFIKDCIFFSLSVVAMVYAKKLSNCKQR